MATVEKEYRVKKRKAVPVPGGPWSEPCSKRALDRA